MSQKLVSYERMHYHVIMDSPDKASDFPTPQRLIALLEAVWPDAVVYVTTIDVPFEKGASHVQ